MPYLVRFHQSMPDSRLKKVYAVDIQNRPVDVSEAVRKIEPPSVDSVTPSQPTRIHSAAGGKMSSSIPEVPSVPLSPILRKKDGCLTGGQPFCGAEGKGGELRCPLFLLNLST
jgi:hypothetical protein